MSELIVLCPNPYRDCGLELTKKAKQLLKSGGYEVAICPVFGAHDAKVIPDDVVLTAWSAVTERAALYIVIGGDGTILHTARYLNHAWGKPRNQGLYGVDRAGGYRPDT